MLKLPKQIEICLKFGIKLHIVVLPDLLWMWITPLDITIIKCDKEFDVWGIIKYRENIGEDSRVNKRFLFFPIPF